MLEGVLQTVHWEATAMFQLHTFMYLTAVLECLTVKDQIWQNKASTHQVWKS